METQTIPATEEITQPTEPDLPWEPDARWYRTYYFEKSTNPDPNIVPGVVRFNCLLRNEGRETLTVVSAHADFFLETELVAQEDFDSERLPAFFFHPGVGNLEMEYGESKVFQVYTKNVERGTYDRVIVTFTITAPNGSAYSEKFHFAEKEEDVTPYSTSDRTDWSAAEWSEQYWSFYLLLQNSTDTTIEYVGMYHTTFLDGLPMWSDFFDKSTVNAHALKEIQTLLPGEMTCYKTGISHRYNNSDERELTMVYKDASGERYLQTFCFALDKEHAIPGAISIYRSIFEKQGVQLLDTPAQLELALGTPQYDRPEIQKMIDDGLSLEELAENLSTIYDVQQFFLEAGIEFKDGDIKQSFDGTVWHFNDSPEVVLRQNYANCGSGSGLINYLLQGDYEEQGYVCYAANRGGHIFNYFRSGDKFYIWDWNWKEEDCFTVFAADRLEDFTSAYISMNQITAKSAGEHRILLLYAYPYEGNHRPVGSSNVRTASGAPTMNMIPTEIEKSVQILYLDSERYAPVFVEAPPVSQWPKDAQ